MPTLRELRLFARYHLQRRAFDHPAQDPDMGEVVSLGYEPLEYAARIRGYGDRFRVSTEGEIVHGAAKHPIFSIASGDEGARKRLLVLAGVHGNEQAGILAIPDVLDAFDRARDRYRGVELAVLTPVNPVGAACFSRFNAQGYDVNRDFTRFDTLEARVVRDAIESARPDFVVALHEGPQDATFMFTNQHVEAELATRVLAALEAGGTTLASHDYLGRALRPPGLAPMTRAGLATVRLWAAALGMMATNAYCGARGIPEITLESSWRSHDRAARLRAHADVVRAVLDELAR